MATNACANQLTPVVRRAWHEGRPLDVSVILLCQVVTRPAAAPDERLVIILEFAARMTAPWRTTLIQDLEKIVTTVLPTDPSFRLIGRKELERHVNQARQSPLANPKDDVLLSLMCLLALPGKGHTRLIPNDAIVVLPLRSAPID